MASRHHQSEATPLGSLKPIQGILLQGLFYSNDLPMECFHYEEAHTCFYASFRHRCIEVKQYVDLRPFQDTLFLLIIMSKDERLCYISTKVQMFYTKVHSIVVGVTFKVTMYGQSFLVFSQSIKCVLGMLGLIEHVISFS